MKALVIGGSGPTGPHVLAGLVERGEVSDEPPQLGHPMPHPKAPALVPDELGTDERGR